MIIKVFLLLWFIITTGRGLYKSDKTKRTKPTLAQSKIKSDAGADRPVPRAPWSSPTNGMCGQQKVAQLNQLTRACLRPLLVQ